MEDINNNIETIKEDVTDNQITTPKTVIHVSHTDIYQGKSLILNDIS